MARTNLVPNPGFETNILGTSVTAGTGGTAAVSRQTTGARSGAAFLRASWSVASTAAGTIVVAGPGYRAPVSPTMKHYVSVWVQPSVTRALRAVGVTSTANSGGTTTTVNGAYITCPAGQWTELTLEVTPATGRLFLEVRVQSQTGVSGTIDVDDVGVVPDPNLRAVLVAAGDPAPVQIAFRPQAGEDYTVFGSALGSTWPVPGGVGVGTGDQVVLVDNRGALNVPIVYRVVIAGVPYEAASVTVLLPGVRGVLQSLDGRVSVRFKWIPNGLPLEPEVNAHVSNVPGRPRPPVRYATGGDGGGALVIRTNRDGTAALRQILRAGAPVLLRTDGAMLDLPAVEIIHIRSAPSLASWDVLGMPADRTHSLTYLLVDDPEPSARLAAYVWDDIDALAITWDQTDALALTWDQAETYDWGQLR